MKQLFTTTLCIVAINIYSITQSSHMTMLVEENYDAEVVAYYQKISQAIKQKKEITSFVKHKNKHEKAPGFVYGNNPHGPGYGGLNLIDANYYKKRIFVLEALPFLLEDQLALLFYYRKQLDRLQSSSLANQQDNEAQQSGQIVINQVRTSLEERDSFFIQETERSQQNQELLKQNLFVTHREQQANSQAVDNQISTFLQRENEHELFMQDDNFQQEHEEVQEVLHPLEQEHENRRRAYEQEQQSYEQRYQLMMVPCVNNRS
ncbi:MAG: hypothetical protein CL947_04520 [Epsilonproteobacteria bacterium]|nr:hypothetical protein [Campylobacterota bacterium]|tara:strand:- start:501 stop:1286 length:786 start_codon:yes stop_codon:yes gene_type:complete